MDATAIFKGDRNGKKRVQTCLRDALIQLRYITLAFIMQEIYIYISVLKSAGRKDEESRPWEERKADSLLYL